MFNIRILRKEYNQSEKYVLGQITIGRFKEKFSTGLSLWTMEDYEVHWCEAIEHLMQSNISKSMLITSITDPRDSDFLFCWPLYRDGDLVRIQNHMLFYEHIQGEFSLGNIFDVVPERVTLCEDGDPVSEWKCTVKDLRKYLHRIKGRLRAG